MLLPGDPAPYFSVQSSVNPKFNFDTAAGRYIVMSFFGSTRLPAARRLLDELDRRATEQFDVTNFMFFGVTTDPDDVARLPQKENGKIWFFDLDLNASKLYGVVDQIKPSDADAQPPPDTQYGYNPKTFILDNAMRVIAVIELTDNAAQQVDAILEILDAVPPLNTLGLAAPVLIVPHVFEPAMCRRLIKYYETKGGYDSGYMRDENGKTVGVRDYSHKRRMDCEITDQSLVIATQERLSRRVVPAIRQAYQFKVTRIERHIVACYDAEQGAHFKAHRDNTTLGTAHRRFAVTINLNSPDYEGGEIWFPEFGPRKYKAPSGAAIVFACSLLHEVPKVTRGKRYAFLPFLYDDAAAAIRERNRKHLGDLSGAGGENTKGIDLAADCSAAASKGMADSNSKMVPLLDGTCGCGNPNGCSTCLSTKTYPLGTTTGS